MDKEDLEGNVDQKGAVSSCTDETAAEVADETAAEVEDGSPKTAAGDGIRSWKIVAAAFIFTFFQGGIKFSIGMLVPEIGYHFKKGKTEAGLVISLMIFFNNIAAPFSAFLIRRLGLTTVAILGTTAAVFGFVVSGISLLFFPSLPVLYLTLGVIAGSGFSCMVIVSLDAMRLYFSRNLGIAVGIGMSGAGTGQFVISPLLQLAIENVGLAQTLIIVGASISLSFLSALLIYLEGSAKIQPSYAEEPKSLIKKYREILSSVDLLLLFAYLGLVALSFDAGFTYNADRAIFFGIKAMDTTYLLGIMGVANTVGKLIMGKIIDMYRSRIILLTVCVMMTHAVVFSTGNFFQTWIGQAVYFALFGLDLGAYYSTAVILLKIFGEENATECTSLWMLTWGLASLAGPGLVGSMFDALGSYSLGYGSVGCLGILGVLLLPLAFKIRNRKKIK